MKPFTTRAEDRVLDDAARAGARGEFASLSDGRTQYELSGPAGGALVVLCGSMTVPLDYWDSVIAYLHQAGLRTLTYSTYGRGASDRVVGRYSEAMFARQLNELIEEVAPGERFHLVATSMGAVIAAGYLGQARRPVTTVSIVGPAGLSSDTARQQRLLRSDLIAGVVARLAGRRILLGHLGRNVADQTFVAPLTELVAEGYRFHRSMYAFFSTLQNLPLHDRQHLYKAVGQQRLPVLLLWGLRDQVTPPDGLDEAASLLRPTEVHTIDCGHMAPFERPDAVAKHVVRFIAQQSGDVRATGAPSPIPR